jgi:diadenosine tetraphosphatase ApaH/serine/threonine PP2A family protein phosphatase
MRYLVLSDIHANLEALEAVLEAARTVPYEKVLVLGDLVGYGADPNGVVDRIRGLAPHAVIRGNHDKVGAGLETSDAFNTVARAAIRWTYEALSDDNRDWLADLPAGPTAVDDLLEICHGTPFDEDVYVFDDLDALRSIRTSTRPVCLYGHTHVPAAFRLTGDELQMIGPPRGERFQVELNDDGRYLVNCGSVGQPRDGDPRAAYGLLDTTEYALTIHRIPYDMPRAQAKIIAAGLPEVLAQRLGMGR